MSRARAMLIEQLLTMPLTDQVYSLKCQDGSQYHWNASAGLRLAQARGAPVVISLSQMGVTLESLRETYTDLDEEYAMTTDLTKPLLFVVFRTDTQLIDGWHRLFKAAVLGVDRLWAYILTQAEADSVLVTYLPPGEGVHWGQTVEAAP